MNLVLVALMLLRPASAGSLGLELRSVEGEQVLNGILSDPAYWAGSDQEAYEDKLYDQIKLKRIDSGYVPMITGEGGQDFAHEVVADTVYFRNTDLPKYMSGAKAVVLLGTGYDPVVGAEYRDCFYILDLTAFYATFPQRMYKRADPEKKQSVLWFEKMDASFVDGATWSTYQAKMQAALDGLEKRWVMNGVVEVGDIYGMFVVEAGSTLASRVSFVSKLAFGDDAGWIAKFGSQLPMVLKAGLKSGFSASVAIATNEQERRVKRAEAAAAAPAPPAP
jgi:hypothetical protein